MLRPGATSASGGKHASLGPEDRFALAVETGDALSGSLNGDKAAAETKSHSRAYRMAFGVLVIVTAFIWATSAFSLLLTPPVAKFALDDVQLNKVLEQRQARVAKCIEELSMRRAMLSASSSKSNVIAECPQVQWLAHPDHRWHESKILVVIMATPEAVPQLDEWLGYDWLHVMIIVKDAGRSDGFQLSRRHELLARYVVELEADSPFLGSLEGQRRRWTAVARALQPLRMRNYKYTWFPETNVRMDIQSVQRMMHLAAFYDVRAGHPSVGKSLGSRVSAAAGEPQSKTAVKAPVWDGNAVEWVGGIGAVAPFFRSDAVTGVLTLLASELMWTMNCGPEVVISEYLRLAGARTAMITAVSYDYHAMANQENMNTCMKTHGKVLSVASMSAYRQIIASGCSWCASKTSKVEMSAETIEQLPMDPSMPPRWRSTRFLHMSRFRVLVVIVAGDDAVFEHWSGYEQFDVAFVYTGASANVFRQLSKDADFAYRLRGEKFTIARRLLIELDNWASAYEYVWFPDSDIDMTVRELQRLVNVASRLNAPLAHPAWAIANRKKGNDRVDNTLFRESAHEQRHGMAIHFVNRVLMDAPLIRVDAVEYLLPVFIGDGTFLDMLMPQLLRFPLTGIVDAAPYRRRPAPSGAAVPVPLRRGTIPQQLLNFGCVRNIAMKTGDTITRFQFHMLVRHNEDKDWCSIEPYRHWIDELRKPKNGKLPEEHTLAWEEEVLGDLRVDPTLLPLWWGERRLAKVRGKNLVIVVAGDTSLHRAWARNPSFDLCVVYFGSNEHVFEMYKEESAYAFNVKGMKWQLVRYALNHIDYLKYEYVWLPDDDITMDADLVAKMFDLAVLYDIRLGQPAVYPFGVHYTDHIAHGNWSIHYVNFVEIMVPLLRTDALEYLFPLWDVDYVESGYGLDSLWPQFLRRKLYGIIDATPCNHTGGKVLGGRKDSFYSKLKMDPLAELAKTMIPYDCFELWNITETIAHVTIDEHNAVFPNLQLTVQPDDPSVGGISSRENSHGRNSGRQMVKLPTLKNINKVHFAGNKHKAFLLPRKGDGN